MKTEIGDKHYCARKPPISSIPTQKLSVFSPGKTKAPFGVCFGSGGRDIETYSFCTPVLFFVSLCSQKTITGFRSLTKMCPTHLLHHAKRLFRVFSCSGGRDRTYDQSLTLVPQFLVAWTISSSFLHRMGCGVLPPHL